MANAASAEFPALRCAVNEEIESNYVSDLSLALGSGVHDVATVSVMYLRPPSLNRTGSNLPWQPSVASLWKDNAAVQVDYGRQNQMSSWYGYVAGKQQVHALNQVANGVVVVNYFCIGTSKPMQNQSTVAWKNVTASYMARVIARKYGLRPVVEPTLYVYPYRVQAGQSDFKFLAALADTIGFRFRVTGSSLYFTNPYTAFLNGTVRGMPNFTMDKLPGSFDTLTDFQIVDGPSVPDGGILASRTLFAINPNTNAFVHATNDYLKYSSFNDPGASKMAVNTIVKQDLTADSYEQAMALLDADAAANRFWVDSNASLWGDSRVAPGIAVNLEGQALSQDNVGAWMVQGCTHNVHVGMGDLGSNYWVETNLGRDQEHIANYRTRAQIQAYPIGVKQINGQWLATNLDNGLTNVR